MSVRSDVGKISVSSKKVQWTIPNFCDLPQTSNTQICSPKISFLNKQWKLIVYPNGHSLYSSVGWITISAGSISSCVPNELIIQLSITNELQENIVSSRAEYNCGCGWYFCTKLIHRSEFDSRKNEIMPKGNLHILLRIGNEKEESAFHAASNKNEDGKREIRQKQDGVSKEVTTQTEEGMGKREIRQKQDYVSKEVTTQTEEGIGVWRLGQDFEKLLLNENITDVILKMQDQEFRAHRCILAARSPVFLAIMTHNTKEKNTGVVDIEDVDPKSIPDFLHYLYTGNVENLTPEKALKLYSVADKYQVNELKQSCLDHLLTNISVDNFCDVISLSLQHSEKRLKDACIDFFQEKSLDIVMTNNWQSFLTENPIIGNELFIKHLQLIKSILQKTGTQIKITRDGDSL